METQNNLPEGAYTNHRMEQKRYERLYNSGVLNPLMESLKDEIAELFPAFTINTPLKDFPACTNQENDYKAVITERLKVAPGRRECLEIFLNEVLEAVTGERGAKYLERTQAYKDHTAGHDFTPLDYGYFLIIECKNTEGLTVQYSRIGVLSMTKTVINQLCEGVAIARVVQYLKQEIKRAEHKEKIDISGEGWENDEDKTPAPPPAAKKLKWLGSPAEFGFIIDRLIQGGYLERPTSSFKKDAAIYMRIFDIETTYKTLANEVSEKTNSLSTKNRNKVNIPDRDKLE